MEKVVVNSKEKTVDLKYLIKKFRDSYRTLINGNSIHNIK